MRLNTNPKSFRAVALLAKVSLAVRAEARIFLLSIPENMIVPLRVGIIGSGYISTAYIKAAKNFPDLAVVACADLLRENAEKRGAEFGLRVEGVEEEIMEAIVKGAETGQPVPISSRCERPRALEPLPRFGVLD